MAQTIDRPTPKEWRQRHQVEKLVQLRADVDSALERLWTLFLYRSTQVPKADEAEWLNRVAQVEDLRTWALKDLETIIGECCRNGQ